MSYQAKINETKINAVKALKEEFGNYDGYIFADYRGLTVGQITDIRKSLRPLESTFRVVKNDYAKIAMREITDKLDDEFVGPTAIAYVKGDKGNEVAKVLFEAAKAAQNISVKGGYLNSELYDASKLEMLSKLPTKLELISSLMGTMKAPVQKLAATLKAYADKLASQA